MMIKMFKNIMIVGYGEIGQAMCKLCEESDLSVNIFDPEYPQYSTPIEKCSNITDVVHICFPEKFSPDFCKEIERYFSIINPKMAIIHTSMSLDAILRLEYIDTSLFPIYHVPVRGKHGKIIEDLKRYPLYAGRLRITAPREDLLLKEYLEKVFGVKVHFFKSAKETVLAKLLSVVWLGMNISFAQKAKMICDENNIDFDEAYTKYSKTDTTGIYEKCELCHQVNRVEELKRPIFYPGYIGGKCVMQDIVLLEPDMPKLADCIIKNNELMKDERQKS